MDIEICITAISVVIPLLGYSTYVELRRIRNRYFFRCARCLEELQYSPANHLYVHALDYATGRLESLPIDRYNGGRVATGCFLVLDSVNTTRVGRFVFHDEIDPSFMWGR